MKDIIFDDFQNSVSETLLRHKSILDILTKLEESQSRVNRAVVKSVTTCGCLKVEASKQQMPKGEDVDLENLKNCLQTHISGELCESCREILESEIGNNLYYLASLCETLDLNLYDILLKEYSRLNALGKFSLK